MGLPDLSKLLGSAGFYCAEDPRGTFHCAETLDAAGVHGIAFQIMASERGWLILLYSAREYLCERDCDIAAIAVELLSGMYVPSGKVPHLLPKAFLSRHKITAAN